MASNPMQGRGAAAHAVKQLWLEQAFRNAHIDAATWHPAAGVEENRRTIERVYGYYAQLYLRHAFLEWAGMAALVGPAFFAGFRDLGMVPDAARRAVAAVLGRASRRVARWAAGDLGFYETSFLVMQKKVFEDQAVMHEAYLDGGLNAVEDLRQAGIIDDATFESWRAIDEGRRSGDAALVADGNRTLLFREQHDILDRFYKRMYDHPPLGRAFTYVVTLAGEPSVPGAKSFAEVFPLSFRLLLPTNGALTVGTPFAGGNIALFANRWALIVADTLPDYLRLIRTDAAAAGVLVGTPIAERVVGFRLRARVGALALNLLTHWTLRLVRDRTAGSRAPVAAASARVTRQTIDLRRPPGRSAAGLPAGTDYRIQEDSRRRPFEVTVQLPPDREYRTQCVRYSLFASRDGGEPDRLIVTLPALDFQSAQASLRQHAAEWGFPLESIEDWRARATLRSRGEGDYVTRAYSTSVFTAPDAGYVRFQLQVAHHLYEQVFVLTALFMWDARAVTQSSGAGG